MNAAPRQRILVISHAHPDFSLGGGELAAYHLFKAYQQCTEEVEDAWFLARADRGQGPTGRISLRRPSEYLWEQTVSDWLMMRAAHRDSVLSGFADLLRALRPTVVHAHHFLHLGLEYLRVIKQVNPEIRILLTLHEFVAICRQNGQMIKARSHQLCYRESPDECHQCFPEVSAEDFWLRKQIFLDHFSLVDHFISPSQFLRQRYIDWGLPANKISVIENGIPAQERLPPRPLAEGETRNRFGFFGQLNPFKGIDVLLEALHSMKKADRKRIVLEVHGTNLDIQPPEFQARIKELSEPLIRSGCVRWVGPYRPEELRQRLAGIDWVVVPSIWWENSPMVIQEAFAAGRPVIASDIGGMAEKVSHLEKGFLIGPIANPRMWASLIFTNPELAKLWEKCYSHLSQESLKNPPRIEYSALGLLSQTPIYSL